MEIQLTGVDTLMGVVIFIIGLASLVVLLGLGVMMTIGAVTSKRNAVTSWPTEQEHAFTTYDQRNNASQSQAWVIALIAGAFAFVFAVGVYAGVEPDKKDYGKDMN